MKKNIQSFIDYGDKSINTDWMLIPAVISAIETLLIFLFLDDDNRIYILTVNIAINVIAIIGYIYLTKVINYTKEVDFLCSGIYILEFCFCTLSVSYLSFIQAGVQFSHLFLFLVIALICSILISALYYIIGIRIGIYNGKKIKGNKNRAGYLAAAITGIFITFSYVLKKYSNSISDIMGGMVFLACSIILATLLGIRFLLKYYYIKKLEKFDG